MRLTMEVKGTAAASTPAHLVMAGAALMISLASIIGQVSALCQKKRGGGSVWRFRIDRRKAEIHVGQLEHAR